MSDVVVPTGGQEIITPAARPSSSAGVHAALGVLELLVRRGPLTLAELARELNLAKSTLHRVCSVLVQRAWVIRDEAGLYELGVQALAIGSRTSQLPIVVAFRSIAAELLTRHDETVCLAVLDGDDSVYVALEETSHPVRLVTHVGSRTPAFASSSGRVILAARPPEHIAGEYGGRPLVTPTGRRLNGLVELNEILASVREQGYAENDEDTAIGLYAVSVPVRNTAGTTLAALTMCIPTSRMSATRQERIVADLRDSGERFSALVGWLPAFTVGDRSR
jgi:IclR family transcriptional regulator, KDG regulon repressor